MEKVKRILCSKQFQTISIIFAFLLLSACTGNKIHLAADAKTGEYLGVVITETRDFESKEVLSYVVKGQDGKNIEKLPQEITIYEP